MADVFNREGRPREGAQEVALGRALEARFKAAAHEKNPGRP